MTSGPTPTTGTARAPLPPHRLASTLLGLVPALVLLTGAVLLVLSWRAELPDQLATHFGSDGPDGFGDLRAFLVPPVALFLVLALAAWALAVLRGREAMTRRVAVGLATGLAAFGAVLVVGLADVQRGLADATGTTGEDVAIFAALAAGLVLGGLSAWAVPGDAATPVTGTRTPTGERLPLGTAERATWSRRVVSPVACGVGTGATVLVAVLAITLRMPSLLVLVPVLLGLVLTGAVLDVTVDTRGLSVRSPFGWPRTRVPLDEVLGAAAAQVRPFVDFGGWGYRIGLDGRAGYVVRTGAAIEVERTGGRRFVVTVDDAATGAALLATLAERDRARPRA